jgi:hypothetical protein
MNMSSCPHSKKILEYVLGLLPEREKEKFKQHLQDCTVCQQELQLETLVGKELAVELLPGYIEERVHARLALRKSFRARFSLLYALRMAAYGVTAVVIALVLPPLILRFPFGQHIDIATYINGLAAAVRGMLPSVQLSFVIAGLGATFMVASVVYSLAHLRK